MFKEKSLKRANYVKTLVLIKGLMSGIKKPTIRNRSPHYKAKKLE